MHNITKKLNIGVRKDWIEEPNLNMNIELVDNIIKQIEKTISTYHRLQRNGIILLLKKLKKGNLKYIPGNILRNKLSPVSLYTQLIDSYEKEKDIQDIFGDTYMKSLIILNEFIDLKDE